MIVDQAKHKEVTGEYVRNGEARSEEAEARLGKPELQELHETLQVPGVLDDYTAVMIAEGVEEVSSEEQYIAAWQHLIDKGLCWRLQGFFGRTAQALIEQGVCTPA